MFLAVVFIVPKSRSKATLQAETWANKRWYIQQNITQPQKEGKPDTFQTQMSLEDIMIREMSLSQKSKCCIVPLNWAHVE